MKINLNVSTENEGTDSPWWFIIDPKQNIRCDPHVAAGQVTGPFFSRVEAQERLDATRYNYGRNAVVYCASGYHSFQYKQACRDGVEK